MITKEEYIKRLNETDADIIKYNWLDLLYKPAVESIEAVNTAQYVSISTSSLKNTTKEFYKTDNSLQFWLLISAVRALYKDYPWLEFSIGKKGPGYNVDWYTVREYQLDGNGNYMLKRDWDLNTEMISTLFIKWEVA